MGQPDQFAKRTFAADAEQVTHGGVEYTSMSTTVQTKILERYEGSIDPERRARQILIGRKMLELNPELMQPIQLEARLEEVRSALRRVLTLRGLATSVEEEARIEACTDLVALQRWHGAAVTAVTAAEALR